MIVLLVKKGFIHPTYKFEINDLKELDELCPELKNRGYEIFVDKCGQNSQGEYADRQGDIRCGYCGHIIIDEKECPFCKKIV